MNDKFTVRDFFAYFLGGIAIMIFFFVTYYTQVMKFLALNSAELKEYTTVIIFFCIPTAYFLGQILHALDTFLFFIAKLSRRIKRPWYFTWPLVYLNNAHRISGYLFIQKMDIEKFWDNCAKLQVTKNFTASEYWYVMNDLFKSLSLGGLIFSIIAAFKHDWLLAIIFLGLSMLFWLRAYFFAYNFVKTVNRTMKSVT